MKSTSIPGIMRYEYNSLLSDIVEKKRTRGAMLPLSWIILALAILSATAQKIGPGQIGLTNVNTSEFIKFIFVV